MNAANRPKAIFLQAIELTSPAERAALLEHACGEDVELRRQVEALLEANQEGGSFLEKPAIVQASTVDEPSLSESVGTVIGAYKLMEQIGEGGFGLVFVAEQQHPVRRKVALKIIKPGMDTREVIARFEAERQALALMDHPNIARVLDAGATSGGHPFFVMELVKGIPIIDYCEQQGLPPRGRLDLFLSVCQAVQHAHAKGIIHRDLKPSNILVAPHDGVPVVKVIDFGIAKAIGQQLTDKTIYTRFTQMIGTPLYMSPEQAEINALDVDIRSDVYSLGVLLYELLTGTTPFDRQRFATAAYDEIRRIIKEEEPPKPSTRLSTLRESLSEVSTQRKMESAKLSALVKGDLDWIVMKALEKDRSRRYETASAFAADVRRFLAEEPIEARPPSTTYRVRKFARKHRKLLASVGSIALLLVAGVVISTWQALRATFAEDTAVAAENKAILERDRAIDAGNRLELAREELRNSLYASQINLAQAAWKDDNVGRTLDLLNGLRPKPGEPDLRGFEWHYLKRLCHTDLRTVELDAPEFVHALTFSADLKNVATVSLWPKPKKGGRTGGPRLMVWDTVAGKLRLDVETKTSHPFARCPLAFSPDGSKIAVAVRLNMPEPVGLEQVMIFDAEEGKILATLGPAPLPTEALCFSPDGARIAAFGAGTRIWDLASGKELLSVAGPSMFGSYDSDGARLAIGRGRIADSARILDATSGNDLHTVGKSSRWRVWSAAFNPAGTRIALSRVSQNPIGAVELVVFDIAKNTQVARMAGLGMEMVRTLAFSSDGTRLAGAGTQGNIRVWDVASGELAHLLKGHAGSIFDIAFTKDGTRLYSASGDRTIKVWNVAPVSKPNQAEKILAPTLTRKALSRDGMRMAFCGRERTAWPPSSPPTFQVRVVDVRSGKIIRKLVDLPRLISGLEFDAEGSRLAGSAMVGHESDRDETRIWDVLTGKQLHVLDAHSVRFSTDGKYLAGLRRHSPPPTKDPFEGGLISADVTIWNARTGQELFTIPGPSGNNPVFAFNPNDQVLAVGDSCMVERQFAQERGMIPDTLTWVTLWDLASGGKIQDIMNVSQSNGVQVRRLEFSPDGRRLAAGLMASNTGLIKIWNTDSGTEHLRIKPPIKPPSGWIDGISFSPDGRRLAVGTVSQGLGYNLTLWDAHAGHEMANFNLGNLRFDGIAFSADGQRLVLTHTFFDADRPQDGLRILDATPLPEPKRP